MFARLSRLFWMSTCSVLLLATTNVRAEEDFEGFLSGLHEKGYGELAALYLQQVKDRPDLPADFKVTWDLSMAQSLRLSVRETPNVDVQQKLLLDAQQFLDKFLKENPTHDEAASAQSTSGEISLFRAQSAIRTATRDKTKKDALIPEARKLLEEARPKFEKAAALYKTRIDDIRADLGKKKKFSSNRAERRYLAVVDAWYGARFQAGTVDYNLGLTFAEPKDPKRKDWLTKAYKTWDAIYQENREGRTGIYAKMWEGKAIEELGDFPTALDIYDEVMTAQPPANDARQAQWTAMFQEVNRYRLMLLGRTKNYDKLIEEATFWLGKNEAAKRTNGYQGIALELAKAHLDISKTAKGAEAAKSAGAAKVLLKEIIKLPSEFQKEAILLSRLSAGGEQEELKTFDEAIAVADAASKAAGEATTAADIKTNWQEAEKAYGKAMEFSADVKDKNRVLHTRFALATAQYMVGKAPEGYATALTLAKENTTYAKAPAAASLAVNIALYLYGQTRDQAALDRINDATEFLLKQWPQHAEADDARIAAAKLKLIQGDFNTAITTFMSVNPVSDRYPSALQFAGQTHWMLYLDGKKKADATKADAVAAHRKKTVELLEQSLATGQKVEGGGPALAQTLQDAQLLLAEVRLEGDLSAEALVLLQPLIDGLKSRTAGAIDRTTLRILVAGIRAFVSQQKTNEAIELGNILVVGGDDIPPVNGVLIEFARLVKGEWKKADAELDAATLAKEEGRLNNAKLAETSKREALSKLFEQLNTRKQYDLSGLVFLAEGSSEIGMNDKAREQFQAIIDRAAADPVFAKQAAKAMIRVRAQLIGLLRNEKNYPEALKQVEALLKEQPNALEPLMEKGNILQALAETDPKRYEEAVKWWTTIRLKLQGSPGKKPKEYYEVIYNCAFCLIQQGTPEKKTQAAQLLNSTMTLNPQLDGPDRVEMFEVLRRQLPAPAKVAPAKAAPTKTPAKAK